MAGFFETIKEAVPKGLERVREPGGSDANPDKLILPESMKGGLDAGAKPETNPLDTLSEAQAARIERYKEFVIPGEERFEGERGDSFALPDISSPDGIAAQKYLKELGLKGIEYKDGFPDFSTVAVEKAQIPMMTADRELNYTQAFAATAHKWNLEARDGKTDWKPSDVKNWKKENNLELHECEDLKTCEFVPAVVHRQFRHVGGKCVASIAGIYSPVQIAAGILDRRSFDDQFDA